MEANLAGVRVGDAHPVRIMGAINVSPESFYKGSVRLGREAVADAAKSMVEEGASIIDIGGMSTAPYLQTEVSVEEEKRRVVEAIQAAKSAVKVPLSVDTSRGEVALAAIKAGASILNDVRGLKGDPQLITVAKEHSLPVILLAHEVEPSVGRPIARVMKALAESIRRAEEADLEEVVIDPAIGFFRGKRSSHGLFRGEIPWYVWDCQVLRDLGVLRRLERPLCIGVSRKSFIGRILGQERPEERLLGSLSSTAIAVLKGAHLVRTHDVAPTLEVVRIAEAIRRGGRGLN